MTISPGRTRHLLFLSGIFISLFAIACSRTALHSPVDSDFSADVSGFGDGMVRLQSTTPSAVTTATTVQKERMLRKMALAQIEVRSLKDARSKAVETAQSLGGHLESSSENSEESVSLQIRIPVEKLSAFLDHARTLGEAKWVSIQSEDITDAYHDLAMRHATDLALRDRLRTLLERATQVEEVLAVEKELTRLQANIETRQAQLDRMQSQSAMSTVSLQLNQRKRLGPVGWIGYHTWKLFSKLFVLD